MKSVRKNYNDQDGLNGLDIIFVGVHCRRTDYENHYQVQIGFYSQSKTMHSLTAL